MTLATLPVVTTRPAGPGDERLLRSLYAETRDDLFLLDPDVRGALLDMQYRAHRDQVGAAHPGAERFILIVDGIGIGSLVLHRSTADVAVLELVVSRTRRGRGIATAVLRGLAADRTGPARVVCGNRAVRGIAARQGLRVDPQSQPRRLNNA